MIKVYLDLDNVLADFSKAAKALHGAKAFDLPKKEFWKPISFEIDNFFATLDPMPFATSFYEELKAIPNISLEILTALPLKRGKLVTVEQDKTNWVHKHIDFTIKVNTITGGVNKVQFCKNKTDVLIDDTLRNIEAWNTEGKGILFKSPEQALKELKDYLKDV